MLRAAACTAGLAVPGVPTEVVRHALPLAADPCWKVAWAAVERWAREVWYITIRKAGAAVQPDVLTEETWGITHAIWLEAVWKGKVDQLPPPFAALQQALDVFQLEWHEPFALRDPADHDQIFQCDGDTPAMLKKLISGRYRKLLRGELLRALGSRRRLLQRTGKCQLEELGSEVDMEGVVDLIAKGSGKDMKLQDLRRLLALAWGVYPTGKWLEAHGFEVEAVCPICGLTDDAAHTIFGCPGAGGADCANCRVSWGRAVGRPMRRTGPKDESDRSCRWKRCRGKTKPEDIHLSPPRVEDKIFFKKGQMIEKAQGVLQAAGSLRLLPGWPVYLDGSAEAPGTGHATASAALVQVGPEGEIRSVQLALGSSGPRSAVAGEMSAFSVLLELLGRGFQDDAEGSVPVCVDCKAVLDTFQAGGPHNSERFAFGGWWQGLNKAELAGKVAGLHKVAAHVSEGVAREQGWATIGRATTGPTP